MRTATLDHVALNVADVDRALVFYHEVLGFDVDRLEEFRAGKVGFPSVRVNPATIIDLMPGGPVILEGRHPLNHFAFRLEEKQLDALHALLVQHEVEIVEDAHPRWGAQGRGPSMKVRDPDGNVVELKASAED